jgi:hypothetical protein
MLSISMATKALEHKFKHYRNYAEGSGVRSYLIASDGIIIEFADGGVYVYDFVRPGRFHVEQMKTRAQRGRGLATYINQFVRDEYAEKIA